MIDVFVITLLVALVQFGIIMSIRPEPAALAFAAVVILTMIAVETFDPRLLWDNTKHNSEKPILNEAILDKATGHSAATNKESPENKNG